MLEEAIDAFSAVRKAGAARMHCRKKSADVRLGVFSQERHRRADHQTGPEGLSVRDRHEAQGCRDAHDRHGRRCDDEPRRRHPEAGQRDGRGHQAHIHGHAGHDADGPASARRHASFPHRSLRKPTFTHARVRLGDR